MHTEPDHTRTHRRGHQSLRRKRNHPGKWHVALINNGLWEHTCSSVNLSSGENQYQGCLLAAASCGSSSSCPPTTMSGFWLAASPPRRDDNSDEVASMFLPTSREFWTAPRFPVVELVSSMMFLDECQAQERTSQKGRDRW